MTAVWAWLKTVVILRHPWHLTSIKKDLGCWTKVFNLCCLASVAGDGCNKSWTKTYTKKKIIVSITCFIWKIVSELCQCGKRRVIFVSMITVITHGSTHMYISLTFSEVVTFMLILFSFSCSFKVVVDINMLILIHYSVVQCFLIC